MDKPPDQLEGCSHPVSETSSSMAGVRYARRRPTPRHPAQWFPAPSLQGAHASDDLAKRASKIQSLLEKALRRRAEPVVASLDALESRRDAAGILNRNAHAVAIDLLGNGCRAVDDDGKTRTQVVGKFPRRQS